MRRRHGFVGGGIAVVALAAALGSATASGGSSARWGAAFAGAPGASAAATDDGAAADLHGRNVIQLYDQSSSDNAFIDVGPSGFSPGDYIVFRDRLLTADQSQQVGDLYVTCTFLFDNAECHGTARLSGRGDITFDGLSPASNRPFLLAITGGTREFKTARGQIRVAPVGNSDDAYVAVKINS